MNIRGHVIAAIDRLGPWPGLLLGALGSGVMAWSLVELAKGL